MDGCKIIIIFIGICYGQKITLNDYKPVDSKTCENEYVYTSILNYTGDPSVKDVYFQIKKVNDTKWKTICHFNILEDCNTTQNCKCNKKEDTIIEIDIHIYANSSNSGASIKGTTIISGKKKLDSEVRKVPDIFNAGFKFGELFINDISIPSNKSTCEQGVNNTDMMIHFSCAVFPCVIELSFNDSTEIRRENNFTIFNKTYDFSTNLILTIKYAECWKDGHYNNFSCLIKRGEYFGKSSVSKLYNFKPIVIAVSTKVAAEAIIAAVVLLFIGIQRLRKREPIPQDDRSSADTVETISLSEEPIPRENIRLQHERHEMEDNVSLKAVENVFIQVEPIPREYGSLPHERLEMEDNVSLQDEEKKCIQVEPIPLEDVNVPHERLEIEDTVSLQDVEKIVIQVPLTPQADIRLPHERPEMEAKASPKEVEKKFIEVPHIPQDHRRFVPQMGTHTAPYAVRNILNPLEIKKLDILESVLLLNTSTNMNKQDLNAQPSIRETDERGEHSVLNLGGSKYNNTIFKKPQFTKQEIRKGSTFDSVFKT